MLFKQLSKIQCAQDLHGFSSLPRARNCIRQDSILYDQTLFIILVE